MNKYICIHGHFYQPPRENPWLEEVELQDSAHPYHDWNEKITEECYRQNAASRILGPDKKIIDIVNNYSRISFDFGPVLLSWLQRHAPEVYDSIIEADRESQLAFSGHGAAIAQPYNHIIMPLANMRDKHTQVIWAICDFEYRFGRKPEGMWLPETAADIETLEVLAEHQIKFTILAPHQAKRVRKIPAHQAAGAGCEQWKKVDEQGIDTTRPYLCRLPSGRSINLFFYHARTSRDIALGYPLQNGEIFAQKLIEILDDEPNQSQLAHIATDGETYGHHYRYADMALAYCLHFIQSNNLAQITVYGEYLEKFPPIYEVEIRENTSWSCSHGVERWKSNCGCCYGRYPSGAQQWRGPLREAMDWLRDKLAAVYENKMTQLLTPVFAGASSHPAKQVTDRQPWEIRNKYISVINNRTIENIENFLHSNIGTHLTHQEKVTALKLLEMQRNGLLMYTSCGWYFDDICGPETVQVMQHAARAIQLAKEIDNQDFEPGFEDILARAPTNLKEFADGREAYQALVKPTSVDLNRVGAHLALSSLFEGQGSKRKKIDIYCYSANIELYDRVEAGAQILATGRATVQSNILLEKNPIDFAVLHFGDHNLIGAVNTRLSDDEFFTMQKDLKDAFTKGDTTEVMRIMDTAFGKNSYSIWHLFKDAQRRILYELLETTWQEIEASFRQIYEHNYTIIQIMRGMNMPLPKAFSAAAEFILNQDLCRAIQDDGGPLNRLQTLVNEANRLSLQLDEPVLKFEGARRINRLMKRFANSPTDVNLLKTVEETVGILLSLSSELDLQTAQNIFFAISKEIYPDMNKKAQSGEAAAKKWVEHFKNLARYLDVMVVTSTQ